jgi:hypothetical protein
MSIDEANLKKNLRGDLSPRGTADDLGTCVATVYVLLDKGELDSYPQLFMTATGFDRGERGWPG